MNSAVDARLDRFLQKLDILLERFDRSTPDLDESLTTEEAAAFLRVHKSTLLKYAHEGQVPYHVVGKTWTFCRRDLIAFRQDHRRLPAPAFRGKLVSAGGR